MSILPTGAESDSVTFIPAMFDQFLGHDWHCKTTLLRKLPQEHQDDETDRATFGVSLVYEPRILVIAIFFVY